MAGYYFATKSDFDRAVRAILRSEREAFKQRRRPRPRFTPFGDSLPTVPCVNQSGMTIPAQGLVKKTGVSSGSVTCTRPDGVWGVYLVNAGGDVPNGANFRAYQGGYVDVRVSSTPTTGDVGPKANSFDAMPNTPLVHVAVSGSGSTVIGWLDPPQVLFGKPSSAISAGGSGNLILHNSARQPVSPQILVPVDWAPVALVTNKLASATYNAGAWYALPVECPS